MASGRRGGDIVMSPADALAQIYRDLHGALRDMGVTLSAALPDDWVAPLITLLDEDDTMTSVRVSREPEIIGICSGCFFGGVKSVGIMGATGFLTCVSEICTLNMRHQIPLFLIVSMRGRLYDPQVFQEVQGRTLLPVIETLGLPYLILDVPSKVRLLGRAYEHARLQKRPLVVCLSKALVTGEVSEF
jgi:sulfopyruvate decarboxylase subunit alpha